MSETQPATALANAAPVSVATLQDAAQHHAYKVGAGVTGACAVCDGPKADDRHSCKRDRCRPLAGRQRSFASVTCRKLYWDEQHPRINFPVDPVDGDKPEGSIKDRILKLLDDHMQRTNGQIAFALRVSEATAARELRKLRVKLQSSGVRVSMVRLHGPRKPAVFFIPSSQPAA